MILFYHEFSPSLFNLASTRKILPITVHWSQPQQRTSAAELVKKYLSATGMLSGPPLQATDLFTQTHPHSCIHVVQCLLWLPQTFIYKMSNKIASWVGFFPVDSYCLRKGSILILFLKNKLLAIFSMRERLLLVSHFVRKTTSITF